MAVWSQVWQRYQDWWRTQSASDQFIAVSLVLATLGGAVFRLVNLRQTLQFLADQGRDAIVAYGILHGDLAFVGPSTSVGSMYLGPLYYYFMAPFQALAGNDPIGPALAVAFIGIVTIPLLYWCGKQWVGKGPAIIAALLYATAPVVIEYTRFSWNPNPAPAVMLLALFCTWRAWRGSSWWWVGAAASFAALIQLHYVALLAAAPLGLFWLADVWRTLRSSEKKQKGALLLSTITALAVIVFSFIPLVIFNWRFDNLILKGFQDFINGEEGKVSPPLWQSLARSAQELHGRSLMLFFEIWGKEWTQWYRQINTGLVVAYTAVLSLGWFAYRKTKYQSGYALLLTTAVLTIVGLSWYRSSVFLHYISFFYPVSYLLTGVVIFLLARWLRWVGIALGGVLLIYILWLSVRPENMLALKPLGWSITDTQAVAERVLTLIPPDKTYALTELSAIRDYRGLSYRYFLITSDHPPVPLEESANADILVVLAESPQEPDKVLGSPVYEIVVYPKGDYTITKAEKGPWIYLINRQRDTVE